MTTHLPHRVLEGFLDGHSPFGTVLAFSCLPDDAHVDFEVYTIIATDPDGGSIYFGPTMETLSEHPTPDRADLRGMIKWDGCSHLWFGETDADQPSGYLHLCGADGFRWLRAVLDRVLSRARELLGERFDDHVAQWQPPAPDTTTWQSTIPSDDHAPRQITPELLRQVDAEIRASTMLRPTTVLLGSTSHRLDSPTPCELCHNPAFHFRHVLSEPTRRPMPLCADCDRRAGGS